MRFQSGSNSTSQKGQQQQGGDERKEWPFKPFEYPAETGSQEFTLESLKSEESRPRRSKQSGGRRQQTG